MSGTMTGRERLDEGGLAQSPVLLGLLLAPLAGAAGVLVVAALDAGSTAPLALLMAMLTGVGVALPVTAFLFPVMHSAHLEGLPYPCLGAVFGAVVAIPFHPVLAGLAGGGLAGLVFMWVTRSEPMGPKG